MSKSGYIFNPLRSLIFIWEISHIMYKFIVAIAHHILVDESIMDYHGGWLIFITVGVPSIFTSLGKRHIRSGYSDLVTLSYHWTLVLEKGFIL